MGRGRKGSVATSPRVAETATRAEKLPDRMISLSLVLFLLSRNQAHQSMEVMTPPRSRKSLETRLTNSSKEGDFCANWLKKCRTPTSNGLIRAGSLGDCALSIPDKLGTSKGFSCCACSRRNLTAGTDGTCGQTRFRGKLDAGRGTGRSLPVAVSATADLVAGGGKSELQRAVCRITSGT
jgi:hypothetical protein